MIANTELFDEKPKSLLVYISGYNEEFKRENGFLKKKQIRQ